MEGGARSMAVLELAFKWIESHPEVHDVIVSGGDPCVMSTERLARLLRRLREIEHVDYVRLATRAPVTLPQRITEELCSAIRKSHDATWVMTHFNHPKELTDEARTACARLADAGLPVMNQTVLLRGVNDDPSTLEALFRGLVRSRVRPYYLLQMGPSRRNCASADAFAARSRADGGPSRACERDRAPEAHRRYPGRPG